MSEKLEKSKKIIQTHVMWSMGAGAVPVPILDIAAVTAVQLDMLKQLSKIYEVDYSESSGKSIISALAGTTLARIGASLIKGIPFLGQIIGGFSMSILSGAATYAIGQVFMTHFETGGTLFNFDMKFGKQKFDEEFEKGKDYAQGIEKTEKKPKNKAEVFEQLDNLVKLKKTGVLSEDEFKTKKEELMAML